MKLVGNTHLVAGGPGAVPSVLELLEREGIAVKGNPDVYVRTYKHFGVEEARELRERSALKPFGERRVFVVAAPDMNREAQNALLKTLEEPSANALFFFVLPAPEGLLPTLRSRAQMLALEKGLPTPGGPDAKVFLSAAPQARIDMLKPLLEKDEEDPSTGLRTGKRDLGAILAFLAALERSFAKAHAEAGLAPLYRARKYITDKGALVKPLLEQVALLVPKV